MTISSTAYRKLTLSIIQKLQCYFAIAVEGRSI